MGSGDRGVSCGCGWGAGMGANSSKFLPLKYSPVIESPCNTQSRDQVYINALGSLKEADCNGCNQTTFVGSTSQLAPF